VGGHFHLLVVVARNDLPGHDVANPGGSRVAPLGDDADRDLAVGEHPGDGVALADRQGADVELLPLEGRLLDRIIGPAAFGLRGHDVSDLHGGPPGWSDQRPISGSDFRTRGNGMATSWTGAPVASPIRARRVLRTPLRWAVSMAISRANTPAPRAPRPKPASP